MNAENIRLEIAHAREVLDFIEKNVETLAEETNREHLMIDCLMNVWAGSKERFTELVKMLGPFNKVEYSSDLIARKVFGDGNKQIQMWCAKSVCCRCIVTGTRKVKEQVPTAYEEREVEREEVVWECPPFLAAEG